MWLTCVLTVAVLTTSEAAISPFECPAAMSRKTSTSRDVNSSGVPERLRAARSVEGGLDETPLNNRVEVRLAVRDGADRALDLLGARVLRQVAPRTRHQRREQGRVVGVGRQDEHIRLRTRCTEPLGGSRAVQLRHPQIHQDHVRRELADELDRLDAVPGLTDDFEVVDRPDDERKTFADGTLVVCDDDADHAGTSSSTRQPLSVGPARRSPPLLRRRSRRPASP